MSNQPEPLRLAREDEQMSAVLRMQPKYAPELRRLHAANVALISACVNARDMLATDRQAFIDCERLRDDRIEEPIAHGLVYVDEGAWLDSDDAEALNDYDRAIELIDSAIAKHGGKQCAASPTST